jgi:hypothetical protein
MSKKITSLNDDFLVEISLEELGKKIEFAAAPSSCYLMNTPNE